MKKQIMLGGLLLLLGSCTPQNKANDPNAIDIAVSLEHLTELKTSQLGKQIRYNWNRCFGSRLSPTHNEHRSLPTPAKPHHKQPVAHR